VSLKADSLCDRVIRAVMMEGMCFMIPKETIMLLSGIPATRKSSFGRYLATEHRFAHYDIECYPNSGHIQNCIKPSSMIVTPL